MTQPFIGKRAIVTGASSGIGEELAVALADALGIDMPISREVHAVVHSGKPAAEAVKALLSREQRPEDAC